MSAVFTKYLALQITTTGSRVSGSSVLTVSPQSEQSVPPGHVFLKVCAVWLRSTSCAKADPDPTTMRQARMAANTRLLVCDVAFTGFSFPLVFILIVPC